MSVPCSLKSIAQILIHKVMVSGSGAFGRGLDREGGNLRKGISVLRKGAPESSRPPCIIEGHKEKPSVCNQKATPPTTPIRPRWCHDPGLPSLWDCKE